jgi:hypothetical protein
MHFVWLILVFCNVFRDPVRNTPVTGNTRDTKLGMAVEETRAS